MNHFSAFFYKEWIKTSKVWWLLFAANLAVAIFVCLRLHNSFRLGDPASNWGSWVFNSSTFFLRYNYLPVLTGLLLAVVQFLPEILNKRIRLFLHLPLNEEKAVVLHLLIGVLLLALAVTPAVVLILTVGLWYFPIEFAGTALSILTPWLLAGVTAYFIASGVLLEQNWRFRITYLILLVGVVRLFFLDGFYHAYTPALLWIVPVTAAWISLPIIACYRFRKGLV